MPRVAVRGVGAQHQVALLRARRHAGGGAGALHVEDHGRHFRVVGQADELVHQRDAGAGGGREGARACPRRADDHAHGRQLVFRLDDGVAVLLRLLVDAVLLAEALEAFHHRGGGRDRIPGAHGRAAEHAAEAGGGIAVDQDLVAGRVHLLEPDRQRTREVVLGVVVAERNRGVVRGQQRRLLRELLLRERADHLGVDADEGGQGAGIGDVLHQDALAHALEGAVAQVRQRHAEVGDVGPVQLVVEWPARVEHQPAAAAHFGHVLRIGGGVERHHQVEVRGARRVAVFADPDLVPRGQALDVRREDVLARDRNAHPEDGLHDEAVRAGRAGAVGRRDLEGEIVDAIHHSGVPLLLPPSGRPRPALRPCWRAATTARTCACPMRRSGSARRTTRSAGTRSRLSPSRAWSA